MEERESHLDLVRHLDRLEEVHRRVFGIEVAAHTRTAAADGLGEALGEAEEEGNCTAE